MCKEILSMSCVPSTRELWVNESLSMDRKEKDAISPSQQHLSFHRLGIYLNDSLMDSEKPALLALRVPIDEQVRTKIGS